MPSYNEEATIAHVVTQLLRLDVVAEVIVVNDCSEDRTVEIVRDLELLDHRVRLLSHPANLGKTEALKQGLPRSRGRIVIVRQDADLEYDPSEIPEVIQPILDGKADVVYGSRFLVRKASRVPTSITTYRQQDPDFTSNLFTNLNLTDVETGYKAFKADIMRNMLITSTGFGFEIEVTAKVAKLKCAIYEVPISYYGRTYEQGKKVGAKDGIAAFWYVIRYNVFCSLKSSYSRLPDLSI